MKTIILLPLIVSVTSFAVLAKEDAAKTAPAPPKIEQPAPQPDKPGPARKRVEVCFVLDTTGSMSGLIEGAKQKIWSIANDIASAKPKPDVRFRCV